MRRSAVLIFLPGLGRWWTDGWEKEAKEQPCIPRLTPIGHDSGREGDRQGGQLENLRNDHELTFPVKCIHLFQTVDIGFLLEREVLVIGRINRGLEDSQRKPDPEQKGGNGNRLPGIVDNGRGEGCHPLFVQDGWQRIQQELGNGIDRFLGERRQAFVWVRDLAHNIASFRQDCVCELSDTGPGYTAVWWFWDCCVTGTKAVVFVVAATATDTRNTKHRIRLPVSTIIMQLSALFVEYLFSCRPLLSHFDSFCCVEILIFLERL